ncbi:hypothetical protein [Micromonospora sp. NPDC005203]|uniref:hypothetical protein n=1 Tax=Micromonospora sp. NPDC005203 TaxID=3364226 RepID=UPI0036B63948
MAGKRRNAQISFYQVRSATGEPFGDKVNWQELLSYISEQSIEERRHFINGANHWGKSYHYKGIWHLLLARKRDEVSSLDLGKDELIDTESDASSPYVEVTFIHFIPKTNSLGLVLGSNAAPRVSTLAAWINQHQVLDEEVEIVPVIDARVMEKIYSAKSAKLVKVTFEADHPDRIRQSSALADAAYRMQERIGDVEISLELKVAPSPRERRNLLEEVQSLAATRDFKKAFASLISIDDDGNERTEAVDFLNNRLTAKAKITVTDKDGKSVRVHSAIDAIYRAIENKRGDLPELASTLDKIVIEQALSAPRALSLKQRPRPAIEAGSDASDPVTP